MKLKLKNDWQELLKDEMNKDYYKKLEEYL